ncbi:unnamed protein product, partial [Discosporangium mesarthrocarpum]
MRACIDVLCFISLAFILTRVSCWRITTLRSPKGARSAKSSHVVGAPPFARLLREPSLTIGAATLSAVYTGEQTNPRVRLPAKLPLRQPLQKLLEELTRLTFTDEAWLQSAEQMKEIAASLAEKPAPFEESPHLPLKHAAALVLVSRLIELSKELMTVTKEQDKWAGKDGKLRRIEGVGGIIGGPIGLSSTLKFSPKKNGLGKTLALIAEGFLPRYNTLRDRTLAVRGVERCLSEVVLIWTTARLLQGSAPVEVNQDFMFHLRTLVEHTPARDRHEVLLVYCRGLFTPGHGSNASKVHRNLHGVALRKEMGGTMLAEAFAEVGQGASGQPKALRAARQAFPFLEMTRRWACRCQEGRARTRVIPSWHGGRGGEEKTSIRGDNETQDSGQLKETGVASLLVWLAREDPSGENIRSLQKWVCEAFVSKEVHPQAQDEPWDTAVGWNEVARCLAGTHNTFVEGEESSRPVLQRTCMEVGQVLRVLIGAAEEAIKAKPAEEGGVEGGAKTEQGREITSMVYHTMFVITFIRAMPQGSKDRESYQRIFGDVTRDVTGDATRDVTHDVIGDVTGDVTHDVTGDVIGDVIGDITHDVIGDAGPQASSEGIKKPALEWADVVEILDEGMASMLKIPQDAVCSERFQRGLYRVLRTWKSPIALAEYFVLHMDDDEVAPEYLRFLCAILGASEETVHSIRFQDCSNREHMRKFPEHVRALWEADPCTLAGTSDPEVIFRMGEDTRSCMGIRRSCVKQNKALLGYLLQGNVRFVGVQSPSGCMEARSVLRLLLRSDSMAPALFMDQVYYASHPDPALEEQAKAQSVSNALGVPLYRKNDNIDQEPGLNYD